MSQTYAQLFQTLSRLLSSTDAYWRPAAFYSEQLPWMEQHSRLVSQLLALSPADIERLSGNDALLADVLAEHLSFAPELVALSAVLPLPQGPMTPVPAHFHSGIPGRKWQQVQAFTQQLPESATALEWCAGKSHLGFHVHHCRGSRVVALEWDKALVAEANERAQRHNVPLQSYCADVLAPQAHVHLEQAEQVLALHACGDLHERLLTLCLEHKVAQLHLAPCCYHKRQEERYAPLSALGREWDLQLTKQDLHTAVMETVTAGATAQRQRQRLQTMRLGFDRLQRDVRGINEYLPIASVPAFWARADFADFCRHCAREQGITLPAEVNWSAYLQSGEHTFWRVSALDLVRFLFRRPLELWLVLDRLLLLEEHGYRTRLGTFCDRQVTPRNLLLQAWRV